MDILLSFLLIILAEFGDKTQISVLILSSKTKKRLRLFLGVFLGFLLADGGAILFGKFISGVVPFQLITLITGLIFLVLGISMFREAKSEEEKEEHDIKKPFLTGFFMIFLAEMGDKTQIASAAMATKFHPVFVFIGIMSGLLLLSGISIYLGEKIAKLVKPKLLNKIAGFILVILGIFSLSALFFEKAASIF